MPQRGDLVQITFRGTGHVWRRALIPDDCVVGLCRELILQSIYTLRQPMGSCGLVIDAGAHIGTYSLLASQHAERVVSLEADPENFRILELNLFRNQADNVTPLNVALWSTSGTVSFERAEFTEGGAISDLGTTQLAAVSLDDLIEQHGLVDCLKLDIEGAEFAVLNSSRRLGEVNAIVGELHFDQLAQQEELVALLQSRGFDVEIIDEEQLSHPRNVVRVVCNWQRIRGHVGIKLAAVAYLVTAGRLGSARRISRKMPLFVAVRLK
jgi:FkbM family methyltransferase